MKRIDEAVVVISRHLGQLGLPRDRLRVLRDSSHVTVAVGDDLAVRAREDREGVRKRMEREIGLCRFLAEEGVRIPATRPTESPSPGPHLIDGWLLGYWQQESEVPEKPEERNLQEIVDALGQCLRAMEKYPWRLPDFREELKACREDLHKIPPDGPLTASDAAFLEEVYDRLSGELGRMKYRMRALHGDCHLGNVMKTTHGYVWTDFESACRGPIEWDLSSLPETLVASFPVNAELYHLLRSFRSWAVAVWCWAGYDRSDEKREAADFHLAELRKRFEGI